VSFRGRIYRLAVHCAKTLQRWVYRDRINLLSEIKSSGDYSNHGSSVVKSASESLTYCYLTLRSLICQVFAQSALTSPTILGYRHDCSSRLCLCGVRCDGYPG
jgi:hypothetical protein